MSEEVEKDETIDCLLNAISDTQEIIRGYDTKAEILGILIALIVGLLNFNLLADYNNDAIVMALVGFATLFAIVSVFLMVAVLFPLKSPLDDIDLGDYVPKNSFHHIKPRNEKFKFKDIYSRLLETDWKSELLLELLKLSSIRERKRSWFRWSVFSAVISLVLVVGLVWRISCICTTK